MFLRAFLAVMSAAAFSAAAQAASACDVPGSADCSQPAAVSPGHPYQPAALLAKALAGKQAQLGMEHPVTLATANALAAMYKGLGRYTDAEVLYLGTLEACERTLGFKHSLTLGTRKSLVSLYEAQGRHEEAALLQKRAAAADPGQYNY